MNERVAAVTGGRRGIGRAVAYALADAGFDVIILDLVEDAETAATLEGIENRGRRGASVVADIAAVDDHTNTAEAIFSKFGTLTCLVNNAGVLVAKRGNDLLDATPMDFDRVMNINLRGTFFFTQAVARRMLEQPPVAGPCPRTIITISSAASGRAKNDAPEYAFSKTCLSLMNEMFALRMAGSGVCAFEVRPGMIKTEMSRDVWPLYEGLIEQGHIPLARMGEPEDVGATVAALASGALRYTTGQSVFVAGGMQIGQSPAAAARRHTA
ncbi:MAG TPA: 3-ketoacyl-ACP reductase [Burkholderiaceae bacterium]|nr:3-ketoacyl-ACP reductase [Burkholderiaceae bacterium]